MTVLENTEDCAVGEERECSDDDVGCRSCDKARKGKGNRGRWLAGAVEIRGKAWEAARDMGGGHECRCQHLRPVIALMQRPLTATAT